MPEVTIPPEWTRENATTRIVDSSGRSCLYPIIHRPLSGYNLLSLLHLPSCLIITIARSENREQLENEIKRADVICIVYSVDRKDTIDRVSLHWVS